MYGKDYRASDAANERVIREHVSPSENILWVGRPRQGVFLRGTDVLAIPFTMLWFGFAVFWEYSVITTKAPLLFKFWGIPFILAGLYITVGRFFIDSYIRSRTIYGLTDMSVVIISGLVGKKSRVINISTLPDIEYKEHRDGSGSINFAAWESMISLFGMAHNYGTNQYRLPRFDHINNARDVYNKILEVKSKGRRL